MDELTNYLAARPSLSLHIEFTGPVNDAQLIHYYRHAMFGVLPSLVEGELMPAIDPSDEAGWYAEIRRLSEDAGLRAWYRQQIADRYRPTSTASSWAQIKTVLLS